MEATAKIKYLKIGPRKVRNVLDLIRNKNVGNAFEILSTVNKKGARLTEELLKSAVANAKNKKMNEATLVVADIRADGGPSMKRIMPRSMGRADRIIKRTTHLSVILKEVEVSLADNKVEKK